MSAPTTTTPTPTVQDGALEARCCTATFAERIDMSIGPQPVAMSKGEVT